MVVYQILAPKLALKDTFNGFVEGESRVFFIQSLRIIEYTVTVYLLVLTDDEGAKMTKRLVKN